MKRLSDTLTYRGIASEAVFTEPPVVGEFGPPYYPYYCLHHLLPSKTSAQTHSNRCVLISDDYMTVMVICSRDDDSTLVTDYNDDLMLYHFFRFLICVLSLLVWMS